MKLIKIQFLEVPLIVFYINKNLLIQKGNETAKKVRQNFHLGCFVTGEPNITSIGLFYKNREGKRN